MHTSINPDHLAAAIQAAKRALENAYAPYSKFRVGAAVLTRTGEVYAGCNVENASYGLTNCAERAAVAAATVAGQRDILLCVVVTDTPGPTTPCGACRQVLAECSIHMHILCTTLHDNETWHQLSTLLPEHFDGSSIR